jgi:predicted transposase YdaD
MAVRKMSDQDRKWLREEYTMEYDALRMDPLYWILQKDSREEGREEGRVEGREEGRQEGGVLAAQQIAINVVAKRFPGLKQRAQKSIASVNDLELLQELAPELSVLSQGEVDEILERLGKHQSQEERDL